MARLSVYGAVTGRREAGAGGGGKPINGTIFVVIREEGEGKQLCLEDRRGRERERRDAALELVEKINDVKNNACIPPVF